MNFQLCKIRTWGTGTLYNILSVYILLNGMKMKANYLILLVCDVGSGAVE